MTSNPNTEQNLINALIEIRQLVGVGPEAEIDRESFIYHLWSQKDHQIFQLANEALGRAGVASFQFGSW